jgi:signal transduction histidine kinase
MKITPDMPSVYGDRLRLVEVLQNLLDNAIKFSSQSEDPCIEVGVRTDRRETIFYVQDNGVGIPPAYHERVFGLFNKLDASAEGTGIGLTLVKRIIEVHGGRIWIESDGNGNGSAFCFTLPGSRTPGL